jgi:hypothetical protein
MQSPSFSHSNDVILKSSPFFLHTDNISSQRFLPKLSIPVTTVTSDSIPSTEFHLKFHWKMGSEWDNSALLQCSDQSKQSISFLINLESVLGADSLIESGTLWKNSIHETKQCWYIRLHLISETRDREPRFASISCPYRRRIGRGTTVGVGSMRFHEDERSLADCDSTQLKSELSSPENEW